MNKGLIWTAAAGAIGVWALKRSETAGASESPPAKAETLIAQGASGIHRGQTWKVSRLDDGGWVWAIRIKGNATIEEIDGPEVYASLGEARAAAELAIDKICEETGECEAP
jgi:hypothetical protein